MRAICSRSVRKIAVTLAAAALVVLGAYVIHQFAVSVDVDTDPGAGGAPLRTELERTLEVIRAKHRVPALAAAVVRGDTVGEIAAVGVRHAGQPERVTVDDRFHLGSDTKAMTATLVALFIKEGRLRWDTPLTELLPELASEMDPAYRAVTVEMLMHHEAGLPDDRQDVAYARRMASLRGSPAEQRFEAARISLASPPAYPPGTRNVYANMSFNILGAGLERLTGESWEAQLTRRLFEPLGMTKAGFGSPSAPGEVDQPWGHAVRGIWPQRLFWIERTPLPPAGAPAGNACMSLGDWARFVSLHLEAARGPCRFLSCASFERLHRENPKGSGFAAGWGVSQEATGSVLQHAGSDGWWYALAVLDPARGEAYLAVSNAGGERGAGACQEAVAVLRSKPGSGP